MYVYIWKTPDAIPFYVGFSKSRHRTNPNNGGGRNWLTKQKLSEIGCHNVIVEIRPVESIVAGRALERNLIAELGRIQTGTGTLTNLREGGEGTSSPSPEHREKLRQLLSDPSHPAHSPESRAKLKKRMQDPDVKAKFTGDANPSKRPEVRAKLKAKWENPDFRAAMKLARTGVKRTLSEENKQKLRDRLASNPNMSGWSSRNGKDLDFEAKRIDGIRKAQEKRVEKMSDPVALAQRKERLKQTMNSEEFKSKRSQWDTPEYRAKLSAAKKAYWEKRRSMISS
jgi:hypothetical protein